MKRATADAPKKSHPSVGKGISKTRETVPSPKNAHQASRPRIGRYQESP